MVRLYPVTLPAVRSPVSSLPSINGEFNVFSSFVVEREDELLRMLHVETTPSTNSDLWEDTLLVGTRSSQLSRILAWIESDTQSNIFLLVGGPGTGKTCISHNIWTKLKEDSRSSISLFLADDYAKRPECLWPKIALAVADIIPAFRVSLCHVLDKWEKESAERSTVHLMDIGATFQKVIAEPIASIASEGLRSTPVIIIDGLDRCYGEDSARWKAIVDSCGVWSQSLPQRFKLLVTTRPYALINDTFSAGPVDGVECRLDLHSGKKCSPDDNKDIQMFLKHKLSKFAPEPKDNTDASTIPVVWPPRQVVAKLVKDSEGLFSWANGVVKKFSSASAWDRDSKLASIMESGTSADYLDNFYKHILDSLSTSGIPPYFSTVLGIILVCKAPITRSLIEAFTPEGAEKTQELCRDLLPILSIDGEGHIELRHSSFASFITDSKRCGVNAAVDRTSSNTKLALTCLQILSTLKFNCGGTKTSYTSIVGAGSQSNTGYPQELIYASQFWANHLKDALGRSRDGRSKPNETSGEQRQETPGMADVPDKGQRNTTTKTDDSARARRQSSDTFNLFDAVKKFLLQNTWIYWIEVMSVLGCIDDASRQLANAAEWLEVSGIVYLRLSLCSFMGDFQSSGDKDLAKFARDGSRFVSTFREAMTFNPAHIYLSALPFFPLLHEQVKFSFEFPNHLSVMDQSSETPSLSLSGLRFSFLADKATQMMSVIALALSGDGKRVAAILGDWRTVRVFNVFTGTPLATMVDSEYTSDTLALAFHGKHLITGSTDGCLRIWDADTGSQLGKTFQAHTDWIRDIAISPDSSQLVSGCDDGTICIANLNDVNVMAAMAPLKGHSDYVCDIPCSVLTMLTELCTGSVGHMDSEWRSHRFRQR